MKSGAKMVSETNAGSSISVATTVAAAAAAPESFPAALDAFPAAAAEAFPDAPEAFLPLLLGRTSGVKGSGSAIGDDGGDGAGGGGGGGVGDRCFCCCCIGGDVSAAGAVDGDNFNAVEPFFLGEVLALPLPFFRGRPLGVDLIARDVDVVLDFEMTSGGGEGVADLRTSSINGAGEMERKASDSLIVVDSIEEDEEEEKIEVFSLLPEKWRRDLLIDLVEEPIFSVLECVVEGAPISDRSESTVK